VVRRDVAMPKSGQVIAVHRHNVAVLIVPAPETAPASAEAKDAPGKSAAKQTASAAKAAKAAKTKTQKPVEEPAKAKPIEKIEDLYGKTIAVVGRSRANIALLNTILGQYGVPADKITTLQFSTEDLTTQLKAAKFDALLAVGPVGSKITAEAVTALARGKESPLFLEIGSSEAIEQQNPVFESTEIPAGAFGGSRPAEAVETIGVSHYIVARRSLDDQVAGNFTKWLFNAKQAQGADFPAFTKLESPDTDKAATLAVHPGALAYLEGEQKGFFERYSEALYWGLMLVSFFGSGAAWLVSYARSTPSKYERRNDLEALIAVIKRARSAAAEELDLMCIEIDDIVERAIRQIESGEIQHNRSSAVTLAADQARRAIGERRAALMKA
jgi:DNA-directed RNA polymerase subunit K/omega